MKLKGEKEKSRAIVQYFNTSLSAVATSMGLAKKIVRAFLLHLTEKSE